MNKQQGQVAPGAPRQSVCHLLLNVPTAAAYFLRVARVPRLSDSASAAMARPRRCSQVRLSLRQLHRQWECICGLLSAVDWPLRTSTAPKSDATEVIKNMPVVAFAIFTLLQFCWTDRQNFTLGA
jgi:hypothetical protein